MNIPGKGLWNRENKTIIIGLKELDDFKDEDGVYRVSEIINNRLHIILRDGEIFDGTFDVPEKTKVFFVSPKGYYKSNVDVGYVNPVISRTHGLENVRISEAGKSHNKNTGKNAINYDTKGDAGT